ncbi:MAG: hypothetical protein M1127_00115 [Patescibacteria group bacterium]|nr:hypothetical protein [Patescibacteria group bacterium]
MSYNEKLEFVPADSSEDKQLRHSTKLFNKAFELLADNSPGDREGIADKLRMYYNKKENFLRLGEIKLHVTVDSDEDKIMLHLVEPAESPENKTLTITNARTGKSKEVTFESGDWDFKLSEIGSNISDLNDVEVSMERIG